MACVPAVFSHWLLSAAAAAVAAAAAALTCGPFNKHTDIHNQRLYHLWDKEQQVIQAHDVNKTNQIFMYIKAHHTKYIKLKK